jgi:serine/threonine-protein kinase
MSPEQATGDGGVGPATDIYALGCVLYEMLVGEPPYTGSTPQAILGKIIMAQPVSATEGRKLVPPHVDAAIRKALEKVPADRFNSASEFAKALGDPGFRHGAGVGVGGATSAGPWKRVAAGFASLAALFALVAGWALFRTEPPRSVSADPELRQGDHRRATARDRPGGRRRVGRDGRSDLPVPRQEPVDARERRDPGATVSGSGALGRELRRR